MNRPNSLLRVLGVAFGVAVIVGNTIGMGILRTPGEIAAHVPSVPLFLGVWLAGAVYALLGALSLAELGAMHPQSGGLYPLVRRGLGPVAGFTTGWTDWMSICGSIAAISIVLGEYSSPLIPPLADRPKVIAYCVIIVFALLLWRGIRVGDRAQRLTSLIKAVALTALAAAALILGARYDAAGAALLAPAVLPAPGAAPGPVSALTLPAGLALVTAIVLSLQSAIYTYDGWSGPLYFGEEVENAGRDIPRAMISGVLLVLAIYLVLNIAFLHVVPLHEMADDPFVAATAAARVFGVHGGTAVRLLMIVSLLAAINALQLMASRVPFAMSRDRLMPRVMSTVNAGGTPTVALLAGTAVALLLVATNSFDSLLATLAFFFVANYALSFTAFFVLRVREPDTRRPFRVPAYPWVPGIALAGSLAFLIASFVSDRSNSVRALLMLAASLPFYFLARRSNPD